MKYKIQLHKVISTSKFKTAASQKSYYPANTLVLSYTENRTEPC